MPSSADERTRVFLCYSQKEQKYAREFLEHLKLYGDRGLITCWSDQDLQAGEDWRTQIIDALQKTKVAVLLLSVGFFNSAFLQQEEIPRILAAARAGELMILQVLVRTCSYEVTALEPFQFALPPEKPLAGIHNTEKRNTAWKQVCGEVVRALSEPAPIVSESFCQPPPRMDLIGQMPVLLWDDPQNVPQRAAQPEPLARRLWTNYRRKLQSDAEIALMQILGMTRALPVTAIYVMVRLHEETRLSYRVDGEQQQARDPQFVAELQREYLEQRVHTALDPVEALCRPRDTTQKRFVILGNPGAGKTTLLKRLAMLAIDEKLPHGRLLPLYIRLNEFASAGTDDLFAFLLRTWQERYGLSQDECEPFVRQHLEEGRALVLLDALDETVVGETIEVAEQSYQRVSRAIARFTTRFEQAICAVTVRKAGYHARTRLPGFRELEVLDFRPEEIKQFVHQWFEAYTPPAKHGLADRLLRELETRVHIQALAANPLLLSLIALDYEANLELPDDRARLYEECVDILLKRWDAERLITRARAFRPEYQKHLLPEIAWHFHLRGLRLFSAKDLFPLIESFLERKRVSAVAEDVLNDIVTENGLLREQAHGIYGFLHLTLQEFFAASYLSERQKLAELLRYLGDPWWEEVILLYAGHTYDASPLLSALLQPVGDGVAPEDIFHSKLLLAGRCLAARPMLDQPGLFDEVSQRLRDLLLATPYTALREQTAVVLVEIARAYPDGEIWPFLQQLLREGWEEDKHLLRSNPLLTALEEYGSPQLQRMLKPLLLHESVPGSIRSRIARMLGNLNDAELEQEMLRHLVNPEISLNIRLYLIQAIKFN
ncbi:MAG TPA: NACHT domain-containing protein [Ktedonobacteraceae bacterium]|nr:NACHT domain-containing protein [Ktedonobacteraceae bacterium]